MTADAETVRRRELIIVVALTTVAFALRAWAWDHVALSYSDEGVYAMSAAGLVDGSTPTRLFPTQDRHSPPVYFALSAIAFLLSGGPSDKAAIAVNVVLGTLLVPLVWLVGRSWFSGVAGVFAAGLVALNECHIILARSGLTDITFALAFLVALWALGISMERGGVGRAVLAGIATGVAWNTKYHGWFVLVIGAMAWTAWVVFAKPRRDARLRALRAWIIASVIAVLCYAPWAWYIHRSAAGTVGWTTYYSGWLSSHWLGNALHYAGAQYALEGPWSRASALAALAAVVLSHGVGVQAWRGLTMLAGVIALGALSLGGAATALLIAGAGIPVLLRRPVPLNTCLLMAWGALWIVAAPFYAPFFRLILPLTIAVFIAAGGAVDLLFSTARTAPLRNRALPAFACLAAAVFVFLLSRSRAHFTDPWRDATGLRRAVSSMTSVLPTDARIDVIVEPTVVFYLSQERGVVPGVLGLGEIDTTSSPRYVITGPNAPLSSGARANLRRNNWESEAVGESQFIPTDLRNLDDVRRLNQSLFRAGPGLPQRLILYRLSRRNATP